MVPERAGIKKRKRILRARYRLGFWEADSEEEIAVQDVYEGAPWESTPVEGRGGNRSGQKPRAPRTVLADATGTLKLAWPLEPSPDKLNWPGLYIPAFISY